MSRKVGIDRLQTGVRNLDEILGGGLPRGSMTIVSGPPGSGKTILSQQICFQNASARSKCAYFGTLSEPTAKTLKYLSQFDFVDTARIGNEVQFVDLGALLRSDGVEDAAALIMEQVKRIKPALVVIDSFRVFDDLAASRRDLRRFGYEVAVSLMAWEATVFLVGEYGAQDQQTSPLFSIADGLVEMSQELVAGEQQRFLQVVKMRGADHGLDAHSFSISKAGIELFAPRATLRRQTEGPKASKEACKSRISRLDELLGDGIPWGSTVLVSGVAGTGKTVASLEFIYRGALQGERGIIFSFEETTDRLLAAARSLGWDLEAQVRRGLVQIHFIPQPDILVEKHLLFMDERVRAHRAKRVAVDSVSVFLHKITDPQIAREKTFQLATVVQNAQAVGFLATDIPYGKQQISRFGVEETVVDGVILLSATEEGLQRQRYIEIYKMRNTHHLQGRHCLVIGKTGIEIYPRYSAADVALAGATPAVDSRRRIPSGVPGLDRLLGGGLVERSATLLSGSTGIGKSRIGLQFALAGATRRRSSLFISFEETAAQIALDGESVGLPVKKALERGALDVLYLPRVQVRTTQLLALITERLSERKACRVVLDGVSHISQDGRAGDALEQLLYGLVSRFKRMGVTSLLTLESPALFSMEAATERDLSAVADNLVLLRYRQAPDALEAMLTIVKTRASVHDRGTHRIHLGPGGLRISRTPAADRATKERKKGL